MRPIHVVQLDKPRPAVVLTRAAVLDVRSLVTVAPITTTIRGLSVEVPVGVANGVHDESVVNLDAIVTVARAALGRQIGYLFDSQEPDLAAAIRHAFDLSG